MEVGVFSGERLNINCEPLVKEMLASDQFADLGKLVEFALMEYTNSPVTLDHTRLTRTKLSKPLGEKNVSIPAELLGFAKSWAKKKSVDMSYVFTMSIKDLHTRLCNTSGIPY